jgi:hypothetical protein
VNVSFGLNLLFSSWCFGGWCGSWGGSWSGLCFGWFWSFGSILGLWSLGDLSFLFLFSLLFGWGSFCGFSLFFFSSDISFCFLSIFLKSINFFSILFSLLF